MPLSSESCPADLPVDGGCVRPQVRQVVLGLLYRDGWCSSLEVLLASTFLELGLAPVDLHLVQFELQMTFGIEITGDAGVTLTDSVGRLLAVVEQRLIAETKEPVNLPLADCWGMFWRVCTRSANVLASQTGATTRKVIAIRFPIKKLGPRAPIGPY